jgi:ElaB/YqjD/DUF883 family membrane-anchored ribosome-binding protein
MGLRELSRQHDGILRELTEERVAALTRISRTLESLIEQLQALGQDSTSRGSEQYQRLKARATQYRWFLEVQREALGLRNHRVLDEIYKIPA